MLDSQHQDDVSTFDHVLATLIAGNTEGIDMQALRFLVLLFFALALTSFARAASAAPNVVFLLTDDQRADAIAALGNPVIKTPNLDALARSGFVFRNAYCMGSMHGAVCNPSRHMLLSGKSLYRYNPKSAEGTFADVMNNAGYVTWHVGKKSNTPHVYQKAFTYNGYLVDNQERKSGHHGRAAADRAIDFLENGWDRSKPLFMYVAFEGPHDPRVAAPEWLGLYDANTLPLPPNFKPFHPFDNGELFVRDERLARWPRTPKIVRRHLRDYYACISSLDFQIGRIVATLKELEQFENTIFVFSSDHGLAVGSHGLFGKQSLYEHSMKSPLIFAGSGISQGESEALVYLFDIFPTVVDLVDAKLPQGIEGKSLVPVMRGTKQQVRDTMFLSYRDCQRALRQGDWKLIYYPKVGVTQLFNLKTDPHELTNLADDPASANRVREMMTELAAQQQQFGDTASLTVEPKSPAAVDEEFFRQATADAKGK